MIKYAKEIAILSVANKFNVNSKELEYIGMTDCSFVKPGATLFQYNILKHSHEKYGSTVSYKFGF